jgi:16S rRNA (uracil1498-N3)-methyltransferase
MKMAAVMVAPGVLTDGATIDLDDAERHHLKVRRSDAEEEVLVFDGVGNVAHGRVVGRDRVTVGVVQHAPLPVETVLAVGAGDKERFLSLAERCTELGVTRLVPLVTERSQTVDTRFRDAALDKARRRAREACKQSENAWAATIEESCGIAGLAERYPGLRWLVAAVGGRVCPVIAPDEAIGWIIGPEGGLTEAELARAFDGLRATGVGLGPAILRFDTAASAGAAITQDRRAATKE